MAINPSLMPHPNARAYRSIMEEISQATDHAGRRPGDVRLVVVSKTHDAEAIRPVLDAGQHVFGENRVQEAKQKWPALRADYPDIELHLIGPLQSNKVAEAVALFDVIQTVDRHKLVSALALETARQNKHPKLLVQVNTGLEPQKAGIAPDDLAAFLVRARDEHNVGFAGLMCIPPVDQDPVPHFRLLAELGKRHGLEELSMGMSSDFKQAIAEGATSVRVGSAIFGARPAAPPATAKSPIS